MIKKLSNIIIISTILVLAPLTYILPSNAAINESNNNIVNAIVNIQISGSVNKPGVYKVPQGTRLVDVISKAGGLKKDAVLTDINLTTPVTDGTTIYIASKAEKENLTKVNQPNKVIKPLLSETKAKKIEAQKISSAPKIIKSVASSSNNGNGLINLNKASAEELDSLPGVGEKLAKSIVKYRNQHGRFKDISELGNITGIGDKKLKKIRAKVTL